MWFASQTIQALGVSRRVGGCLECVPSLQAPANREGLKGCNCHGFCGCGGQWVCEGWYMDGGKEGGQDVVKHEVKFLVSWVDGLLPQRRRGRRREPKGVCVCVRLS